MFYMSIKHFVLSILFVTPQKGGTKPCIDASVTCGRTGTCFKRTWLPTCNAPRSAIPIMKWASATFHRLADFYATSTDYLLGRTDQFAPYPAPEQ